MVWQKCSGIRRSYLAPEYKGITGLLNPVFFIETGANRRDFLYLDSVVISTDGYVNPAK